MDSKCDGIRERVGLCLPSFGDPGWLTAGAIPDHNSDELWRLSHGSVVADVSRADCFMGSNADVADAFPAAYHRRTCTSAYIIHKMKV